MLIKNNNVKVVETIFQTLIKYPKISIFGHINQDNDAYCSSLALCYFLRSQKIDARVVDVELINSKVVLPLINHDLPSADAAFISGSLGVLLDIGNTNMISSDKYKLCQSLVRIDHHLYTENVCDLEWVDPEYSSTCEMIGWFILHNNQSLMSQAIANLLYAGILADTGMLMYPNTQSSTFELITQFYQYNFNKSAMQTHLLLHPWKETLDDRNLSNEITVTKDSIAYLIITDEIKQKYHVQDDENKIYLMNNILDFKVWFSIYHRPERQDYKVSIRSHHYDVHSIAVSFAGGGHRLASGFSVKSLTEVNDILAKIRLLIKSDL